MVALSPEVDELVRQVREEGWAVARCGLIATRQLVCFPPLPYENGSFVQTGSGQPTRESLSHTITTMMMISDRSNIIPSKEVDAVRDSVMSSWQQEQSNPNVAGRGGFGNATVAGSFLTVNRSLAPYLAHPNVLGIAQKLWGPRGVKLTSVSPVPRFPGTGLSTSKRQLLLMSCSLHEIR